MADNGGFLTKHGFPRGYRFVPTPLELVSLLSGQIHGGGNLFPPLDSIFHDVPILHYHPEELYETYKEDAEHRYIYFFSVRKFQKQQGAIAEEKEQKEPRPVRVARGGGWRPSGGGQVLARSKGGSVAGRMVTLVFYDGGRHKSSWGMHEFVVPVDDSLSSLSPIPKHTRFYDLALYRLYILRSGDMESDNSGAGSSSHQMLPNAYDHYEASPPPPPPCPQVQLQPWGVFAAGASTSLMPSPPAQHPGVEHARYYHHLAKLGAASASCDTQQQQAHNMPAHGAGLPGDSCQFASPLAPAPAPPAAASTAAHQAPATDTHGADQEEAGHFGATCSPCSPPPLEGVMPAAEDERVADDVDDDYHRPGMPEPDWDLGFAVFDNHSFQFTMEDIMRDTASAFDEPPAGGTTKQEPPAALGCY